MDKDKPLAVEVLLAWGCDWQRHLEAEAGPGRGCKIVDPRSPSGRKRVALGPESNDRPAKQLPSIPV